MNYYPFHIGDYLSATRHLSWEEDGAYRRLLDVYYTTEKPLPIEFKHVCRLVLATTEAQREAVQTVLDEFFESSSDGWVNHRADAELDNMRMRRQKQRDKANKRWHMPVSDNGNTAAIPQQTNTNATALDNDANAMPPVPVPVPVPKNKKSASAPALVKPDDVEEQVWKDWVQLRKGKRATVSATVVDEARKEAGKAGMPLGRFLAVWCARGSQGLSADWLKPNERMQQSSEIGSFL